MGLLEISRKSILPDYNKISLRSLAKNEKTIKKDGQLHPLLTPFNRTIRNAIAHGSTELDPIEKKIEFVNRHKTISISYLGFTKEVKEFSALVYVLNQIQAIRNSIIFQIFKDRLEYNKI